jgi:hypothetical protein
MKSIQDQDEKVTNMDDELSKDFDILEKIRNAENEKLNKSTKKASTE